MALCPLLQKECIKEQCAWWYVSEYSEYNKCVINIGLGRLFKIAGEVDVISKEFQAFRMDSINMGNEM